MRRRASLAAMCSAGALGLAGCGGGATAPGDVASTIDPSDLPSDRLAVLETRRVEQGPDDQGNGWRIEYPQVSGIDHGAADRINAQIAAHLGLDALALPPEAAESDHLTWYRTVTFTPGLQTPELLGIEFLSYVETGGAHGMPSASNLTFDLATGEPLRLEDLLAEGAIDALAPLVAADLAEQFGEDQDATEQTLLDREAWTGGFDSQGNLVVTFQPYSVGPYSLGMPEVTFAPERLFELGLVPAGGLLEAALDDVAA